MSNKLDSETRLLAAIAYGEASTEDIFEEMAAIANVMVRQQKARGYSTIAEFTSKESTFSFVVRDGNERFAIMKKAREAQIEKSAAMSNAVRAARNAMAADGVDYSGGAYFWDGSDIKANYNNHFKVRHGIKFTDSSHNIYGIKESTALVIKTKTTKRKVDGKIVVKKEEIYRYDHIYESTAGYGGTIFWRQNPDYLRYTRSREYM